MESEFCVSIASEGDIVRARQQARAMAEKLGFGGSDMTFIATAISEVARNIVQYARNGEIVLQSTNLNGTRGITLIARDQGPGIPDLSKAMQDGYSTGNGLGLGLPGAKRLMDEFNITSEVGKGTTVTMKKWNRSGESRGR